ncbi:MAG TPA: transporter substrate-binding domain-containing protein [Thermoanaerobaculia bacterium]|nr:transporter substrate-binding domain-containing protein [Thermoanaerobaculia bacterium]
MAVYASVLASAAVLARPSADSASSLDETLPIPMAPWKGDLGGMAKRRVIRALVVYDKMLYFIDRGTQHGASYEGLKFFERYVDETRRTGGVPIRVLFYPVRRDQIIPMLRDGRGDLAAADLTVTPERRALVDFSSPIISGIDEIAVTGPASPAIETLDDLSGREVFVRRSSGYWQNIERLNERFAREGKARVRLRAAPEDLQDEDLLEMLNAGLVPIVVCDDDVARFWARIFPEIRPHPGAAVARGAETAWMFRKDSPELKRTVDALLAKYPQGSLVRNELIDEYMKSTQWVKHARSDAELAKFRRTVELFRKYGKQYDLDALLMMAQGYQESHLNQDARSRVGAIGVMQLMPETGRAMDVGDIHEIEANIHAGVKYIRFMEDKYFAGAPMTELDKGLFAFASYDAGPSRIEELRRIATERGLDPNVWFNNVEIVAAATIGRETVQYVGNIYKYYIAYTLIAEDEAAETKTLRDLESKKP